MVEYRMKMYTLVNFANKTREIGGDIRGIVRMIHTLFEGVVLTSKYIKPKNPTNSQRTKSKIYWSLFRIDIPYNSILQSKRSLSHHKIVSRHLSLFHANMCELPHEGTILMTCDQRKLK